MLKPIRGSTPAENARDIEVERRLRACEGLTVSPPLEMVGTGSGSVITLEPAEPTPAVLVTVILRPVSPVSTIYLQPYGDPFFDATVRTWDDATASFTNPLACLAVSAFSPGVRTIGAMIVQDTLDLGQYVAQKIPGVARDKLDVYLVRHRDACFFRISTGATPGNDDAQAKLIRYTGLSGDPTNPLIQNLAPNAVTVYNAASYAVDDVVAAFPVRIGAANAGWRALAPKPGFTLSVYDETLVGSVFTVNSRVMYNTTALTFEGDGWTTGTTTGIGGGTNSVQLNKVNGVLFGVVSGIAEYEMRGDDGTVAGNPSYGFFKDFKVYDSSRTDVGRGISAGIGIFRAGVYAANGFYVTDIVGVADNRLHPTGAHFTKDEMRFKPNYFPGTSVDIFEVKYLSTTLPYGYLGITTSPESWHHRVQTNVSTFFEYYCVPSAIGGVMYVTGGVSAGSVGSGNFIAFYTTPGTGVIVGYPGIDGTIRIGDAYHKFVKGLYVETGKYPPGGGGISLVPITRRMT